MASFHMELIQPKDTGEVYEQCGCNITTNCNGVECNDGDWYRADISRCPVGFRVMCERLATVAAACPGPAGTIQWDTTHTGDKKLNPPHILCGYEPSAFKSWDDVVTFQNSYPAVTNPTTNEVLNDNIYPFYCIQPEDPKKCPVMPNDPTKTMPCPNLLSTAGSPGPAACRAWAALGTTAGATPEQISAVDGAYTSYCSGKNPQTDPPCACIARGDDPVYNAIKGMGTGLEDGCWYTPCKDSSPNTLVPSIIRNKHCPDSATICNSLVNVITNNPGTSTVTIQDIEMATSCGMGGVCYSGKDCRQGEQCVDRKCVKGNPSPQGLSPWQLLMLLVVLLAVVVAVLVAVGAKKAKAGGRTPVFTAAPRR